MYYTTLSPSILPRKIVSHRLQNFLCGVVSMTLAAFGSLAAGGQQPVAWGADLFAPSPMEGATLDTQRRLPITSFYDSGPLEPAAAPGTLVRSETATDYSLPPGVSATRILYHTVTADQQDVLSSGVVLVPYGKPPQGGWPLLAWSHGTSGVARDCAPSRMRSLFYNWEGLYGYLTMGYAVVATDYAGLGARGRHAYLDMLSNGADVIYSVLAAHAAVPNLSRTWIAIGHSQGGLSTLGVAQLEFAIRDPYYLGTVSLAGASDLSDGIDSIVASKAPVLNGLIGFWVFGVKTLYPNLNLKDVLTPKALAIYNQSVEDGCSAASGAFSALSTDEVLQPRWRSNKYIKQFLARNQPGTQPVYGPMLLVGGAADPLFTESAGNKIVLRLCKSGVHIQRNVYPGLGHDPVVYGSLKDQLEWIADRFAGKPAPINCPSQ